MRDAAESRRLVSVLYARLSDSETLDAVLDSEQARYLAASAVDALRREVERYAGRLIKFSGTEALAVFGIGQAHEDDPERSVTAALGFREAARISAANWRSLGRSTGAAARHRDRRSRGCSAGASLQPDDAVVGAAPTIARRLAESAEAGEIRIDATTHALVTRSVETRTVLDAEGARFLVLGKRIARAAFDANQFVGRDAELQFLVGALEFAMRGRGARVAVVGEPGIGKSRLVREFLAQVPASCGRSSCGAPHSTRRRHMPWSQVCFARLSGSRSPRTRARRARASWTR